MRISVLMFLILLFLCGSLSTLSNFKLGLENISEKTLQGIDLKKEAFGLVTNQTGKDSLGERNVDVLRSEHFSIKAIFVPEHGLEGVILAAKTVDDAIDKTTGIRVVSLYRSGGFKVPSEEDLTGITTLIFDIQDCGMRHYTYISTLFRILEAAVSLDKKVLVLDRPNPLGLPMEGPLVEESLLSFISIAPIPLRHGMTVGELALYFNKYFFKNKVHLSVIPMEGYSRAMGIKEKLLAPLSPNIKSLKSCLGYSFLGLLGEIKPFDVGVGTDKVFQSVLLSKNKKFPLTKWMEFKKLLGAVGIECKEGIQSYFNERKNKWYEGQDFRIKDINSFQSTNTLFSVLDFFKKANVKLTFSGSFDKAMGTSNLRDYLEGKLEKSKLTEKINLDLKGFYKKAFSCLLYSPAPKIVEMR